MFPLMHLGMATAVLAVLFAAPAGATEDEYLEGLQERYTYLQADPLLSLGHRACAATNSGVLAPDVVIMIREDLGVATGVAMDILSAAQRDLC